MTETTDPTRRDVLASGAALAASTAAGPAMATSGRWPLPGQPLTLTFVVPASACAKATLT